VSARRDRAPASRSFISRMVSRVLAAAKSSMRSPWVGSMATPIRTATRAASAAMTTLTRAANSFCSALASSICGPISPAIALFIEFHTILDHRLPQMLLVASLGPITCSHSTTCSTRGVINPLSSPTVKACSVFGSVRCTCPGWYAPALIVGTHPTVR